MYIVLDTNIIYGNWYLRGPNISLLEKHIKPGQSKLVVPEIVVLEVKNLFRKEVEKSISAIKKLVNLAPDTVRKIPIPDIEKICRGHEKAFTQRLKDLKAERPTHSDIPHTDLVDRALSCRKPFTESDKGYRDSLLWEVILRKVVGANHTTYFITNNHKDFGSKKKKGDLHSHLVEDLIAAKHPQDSVRLYGNLKTFANNHIIPHLKRISSEIIEALRKDEYKLFSVLNWFIMNREKFITSANQWIESLFEPEMEDAELCYIEDPESVTVERVYGIDDERIYIDAVALSYVTIEMFVFKSDYFWLSEKYPLDILDNDWNKHYMWAQMCLKLPINFSLIFNILSKQIEEFEIDPIGEIFDVPKLWSSHIK